MRGKARIASFFTGRLFIISFLDAIAPPSTYPCQSVDEGVSDPVIDSFIDSFLQLDLLPSQDPRL